MKNLWIKRTNQTFFLSKPFDRLHVVTWNVATAEPPEDVTSLLQLDVQPPTDLYVIG